MDEAGWWKRGEQIEVATAAGISKQYLNHILHRRKRALPELAVELERATAKVLGRRRRIPWTEFSLALTTEHKAFFGEAREEVAYNMGG